MLITATVCYWNKKKLQVSPQHFVNVTTALYAQTHHYVHKTQTTHSNESLSWARNGCVYIIIICVKHTDLRLYLYYCYSPGQGWRVGLIRLRPGRPRNRGSHLGRGKIVFGAHSAFPFKGYLEFYSGGSSGWGVTLSTLFNLHRV